MENQGNEQRVKTMFCAQCQQETDHVASIEINGELVLTCSVCGRFVKLPVSLGVEGLDNYIQAHKVSNSGHVQVSIVMDQLGIENKSMPVEVPATEHPFPAQEVGGTATVSAAPQTTNEPVAQVPFTAS